MTATSWNDWSVLSTLHIMNTYVVYNILCNAFPKITVIVMKIISWTSQAYLKDYAAR